MPRLIRLYIRHVLIGFGLAGVLTVALIWFDVAHLRHLVTHTEAGPLAVGLLWLFNGLVFAGVQFGIAVMSMAEPQDDDPAGGLGQRVHHAAAPQPWTVAVGPSRDRPRRSHW